MAPEASLEKYRGRYNAGYAAIQQERLARMKALGLVAQDVQASVSSLREWAQLSDDERAQEARAQEARAMEIYAAMVDDLDIYIGQLMAYLKSIDELDNTLIVFMSDNGAEGHDFSHEAWIADWVVKCCDNSLQNMGKVDSYVWYGPAWASVSSTPQGGLTE